jgi:hypothetical protein
MKKKRSTFRRSRNTRHGEKPLGFRWRWSSTGVWMRSEKNRGKGAGVDRAMERELAGGTFRNRLYGR